jgi:signal transduction histidine kinase
LEQLQRHLDQSSIELRRVDQEVDDARVRASELPVLQEKLKGLSEIAGPDASRINTAHAAKSQRAREEKVPGLIIAALQKLVRDIGSSQSAFQTGVEAQLDDEIRQGANRELFKTIQVDLEAFASYLAATVASIERETRAFEQRVSTQAAALAARHALQEAEYRAVIATSEEQGERAAERLALQAALAVAQSAAVANVASHAPHPGFENVLAKLALDDNSRVRQAAEHAALRRRDSRHASTLGKQHEDRINSKLDDIEARFGSKGRDAVKRAAEQIANIFARELYHEVIKLVSPLAASADRLQAQLSIANVPAETLAREADRIGRRVGQLRAVLDAMRAYTAQPALTFRTEVLREVIQEATTVAIESDRDKTQRPSIDINVTSNIVVDVTRARLVQALTNVLLNAIESYRDVESPDPIKVTAVAHEGLVSIRVEDSGCGMSAEAQRDALTLFATSKPNGTGFGLPLAAKIVESEHGGRLSIDSVKDRGTIVHIIIPEHHQVDRA